MLNEKDKVFLQENLTFWHRLNNDEIALLLNNTTGLRYKKGENIHSADNDCIGVLIVKSGELRTYILSEEGKEITLYRLGKGEVCVLSASCLIKDITFDVHIDAEVDTEALLISSYTFSQLQSKNVYIENFVLQTTVSRFSDVMFAMQQILFLSLDKRLAAFLIDEAVKNNSDNIKLTHEQIAKYIGTAREVVTRMLKHFESDGLVSLYRGGVKIADRNEMRKLLLTF
ncbi:CRP/FNR family transcriptional regulator [Ruminiclostridium sufflavum DSM 19573]|uniref:CRP/FNR family transcriptional regulator n=1 Tax=Ruminiclostridium sufflavum DSM 19573 TaxID=1121337 RepID=A0A318XPB9_9FIRM|nr:Crp/Fnr family transcriptional regulator [Ruminiclostridium sufflavum]PYG87519.1 CRP/FNR family transcriptional regulator [Ruminiclostridium sufflavum DSM 19573]